MAKIKIKELPPRIKEIKKTNERENKLEKETKENPFSFDSEMSSSGNISANILKNTDAGNGQALPVIAESPRATQIPPPRQDESQRETRYNLRQSATVDSSRKYDPTMQQTLPERMQTISNLRERSALAQSGPIMGQPAVNQQDIVNREDPLQREYQEGMGERRTRRRMDMM